MRTHGAYVLAPVLALLWLGACSGTESNDVEFAARRDRMVEQDIRARGVEDERVLAAVGAVPRHLFVPERYRGQAYANKPLPIGLGQTISQPYLVARMSELLDVQPGDKVLEIGTGSGYQAAILAKMGVQVYSIEIIPELAGRARDLLSGLAYNNVDTRIGDGHFGWPDPIDSVDGRIFDGIIVTAAPDHVPQALLGQLKTPGKMVIPIGPRGTVQALWLVEWRDGDWVFFNQGGVRFVPLVREGGR